MDELDATHTGGTVRNLDVGDSPPSEAVVLAVADARGCDPLDLPPLNGALDPDALDSLFGDRVSGRARTGGRVTFEYADCTVTVTGTRDVFVDATD
ncbi:hypothetical protein M0R89_15995 [Halorussus limi]|uniref:Halobacterial output domain-containing protein n=1 Tax=Halorussus limi TaxID=2938695 RepID=A0A8U0HT19_9EURY|nr:HalOD1 output domain-containing protein [Halorussus limi]UPV74027.1 hypothetical protein M0R89_15995 [Halorussus limi]